MKQVWENFAARIDAMSLRERCLVFAVVAGLLAALLETILLDPLFTRQSQLSQRIAEQNNKIAGIDGEIVQKLRVYEIDPDRVSRERLQVLQRESLELSATLRGVEKGLVAPDKVALLLESILKANGRLDLLSLKSMGPVSADLAPASPPALSSNPPSIVSAMTAPAPVAAAAPSAPAPSALTPADAAAAAALVAAATPVVAAAPVRPRAPSGLIYRHGVEIVVRGEYADLLLYLKALEAMQGQLFWGDARLSVDIYPNSILTLSVYTLSLDPKWMKL
jgi:MSHA biogenesis protein MshJ